MRGAVQHFRIYKVLTYTLFHLIIYSRIKKVWYMYTMEYYSAIKKNKIMLPFAVTGMDPETVILSEVSQTEEDKYPMIQLMCGI